MKIEIEKRKIKDEMIISFYMPFNLYKKIYLSRKDYILDLVTKSFHINKGKNWKYGENYVDNLGHRVILDIVKTLKIEEAIEKELTSKEKEEYQLAYINDDNYGDVNELIYKINFIYLKLPTIKNDFDYKNINLPKTLPENKEWYLKYISSLLFEYNLLTKSSVTKLTNRYYGIFKYDLYTIDFKTKEYTLIDKELEVKTFYEFDNLAKNITELRYRLRNMNLNETREFITVIGNEIYSYKITLISIYNKNKSFYKISPYLDRLYRYESYSDVIKYLTKTLKEEVPYFNRLLLENSIKEHLLEVVEFNGLNDSFINYKGLDFLKPTRDVFKKINIISEYEIFCSSVFRTNEEVNEREILKLAIFNLVVHDIAKKENIKITYSEILDEIKRYNNFDKEKYAVPYKPILIDKNCLTDYQITKIKNEILRKKVMDYLININSNNPKVESSWNFELGLNYKYR